MSMNRRSFLITAGSSALLAGLSPLERAAAGEQKYAVTVTEYPDPSKVSDTYPKNTGIQRNISATAGELRAMYNSNGMATVVNMGEFRALDGAIEAAVEGFKAAFEARSLYKLFEGVEPGAAVAFLYSVRVADKAVSLDVEVQKSEDGNSISVNRLRGYELKGHGQAVSPRGEPITYVRKVHENTEWLKAIRSGDDKMLYGISIKADDGNEAIEKIDISGIRQKFNKKWKGQRTDLIKA